MSPILLLTILKINKVLNFKITPKYINFNGSKFIGTFEFAEMCKKWSLKNEFSISSEIDNNCGISKIKETNENFWGENEAVSTIIATNWIITEHLKNKGK